MTEQWHAFRAYNSQAQYGYGTSDEADRYCDILNENRDINVFGIYPLSDTEAAELRLSERDDCFNLDDALAAHAGLR